jgi:gem associated protein 5
MSLIDRSSTNNNLSCLPRMQWTVPGLGGFVYAIAFSPFQPALAAVGVGDGTIRVWDTEVILFLRICVSIL